MRSSDLSSVTGSGNEPVEKRPSGFAIPRGDSPAVSKGMQAVFSMKVLSSHQRVLQLQKAKFLSLCLLTSSVLTSF